MLVPRRLRAATPSWPRWPRRGFAPGASAAAGFRILPFESFQVKAWRTPRKGHMADEHISSISNAVVGESMHESVNAPTRTHVITNARMDVGTRGWSAWSARCTGPGCDTCNGHGGHGERRMTSEGDDRHPVKPTDTRFGQLLLRAAPSLRVSSGYRWGAYPWGAVHGTSANISSDLAWSAWTAQRLTMIMIRTITIMITIKLLLLSLVVVVVVVVLLVVFVLLLLLVVVVVVVEVVVVTIITPARLSCLPPPTSPERRPRRPSRPRWRARRSLLEIPTRHPQCQKPGSMTYFTFPRVGVRNRACGPWKYSQSSPPKVDPKRGIRNK